MCTDTCVYTESDSCMQWSAACIERAKWVTRKCAAASKMLKLAALFASRHRGNGICQFCRKTQCVPVAMYAAISCSDNLLKWTAVVSANVCTSNFEVLPWPKPRKCHRKWRSKQTCDSDHVRPCHSSSQAMLNFTIWTQHKGCSCVDLMLLIT